MTDTPQRNDQRTHTRMRCAVVSLLALAVTAGCGAADGRHATQPGGTPAPTEQAPAELAATDLYEPAFTYNTTADDATPVSGRLELVDTYEHNNCAEAARTEPVRQALETCTGRLEAVYRGTAPDVTIVEQVLLFDNNAAPGEFYHAFRDQYNADLVAFRDPTDSTGASVPLGSRTSGAGRYMILTVLFVASPDPAVAQSGEHDMQARNRATLDLIAEWNRDQAAGPSSDPPLTVAELYRESPWPYDVTWPSSGSRSRGELSLIQGYDHTDCAEAALTGQVGQALATCTGRVEAIYEGTRPGTVIGEQVLTFADEFSASAFLERYDNVHARDILPFQDPTGVQADVAFEGGWNDGTGRYVVLTILLSAVEDDSDLRQGGDDAAARQHETINYLSTRP